MVGFEPSTSCLAYDVTMLTNVSFPCQTEVEGEKVFTLVRALARHRVLDVSLGPHHSAVVVEPGHVYTLGRNSEGQLGMGNNKPQNTAIEVKVFEEKPAFVSPYEQTR